MLYTYKQPPSDIPETAKRFLQATQATNTSTGMILSQAALQSFLDSNHTGKEIQDLVQAITDEESQERVDHEIKRRIVTARITGELANAVAEIDEVLGQHQTDATVAEVPLILILYSDDEITGSPIETNIIGKKGVADAIRNLYSRLYLSPHPIHNNTGIVIMRMPLIKATAIVTKNGEQYAVQAVEGMGLFTGQVDETDTYFIEENGTLINKTIGKQNLLITRNPRTGELVKSTPEQPGTQKITDEQAINLALAAKKAGITNAVFALNDQSSYLLAVGPQETLPPAQEPMQEVVEEAQETIEEPIEESPQEVVEEVPQEVVEEPIEEVVEETPQEPMNESVAENQQLIEELAEETPQEQAEEQEEVVDLMEQEIEELAEEAQELPVQEEATEEKLVEGYEEVMLAAKNLMEQSFNTIELTLRNWLFDEQPETFVELVNKISNKRQIPYKNRLLTLYEMKESTDFSNPSPDDIRFCMETMQRFTKEF